MKKQNFIKIALIVNKGLRVYIHVTRDEYNRCYNSPTTVYKPNFDTGEVNIYSEYCAQIPLTRFAYHPRTSSKDRWYHFGFKDIGKDFFNYLLNKYKPLI